MVEAPPTSVLLPTVEWNEACREVAEQLDDGDELLVVCDTESDPVAGRRDSLPAGVRVVVAGEPEGCSGKANAIAAGMRAARRDRLVWTDGDFHHPDDWLATLKADYERLGPVSELPVFVGRDPLARLFEPVYLLTGTVEIHRSNRAWGGSVVFDRTDLDEAAFLSDLERTVSDDGLLGEYLEVTAVDRTHRVEIGGSIRESLERHVRWVQIVLHHGDQSVLEMAASALVLTALAIVAPVATALLATAATGVASVRYGGWRNTVFLTYPALLVTFPLFCYAVARRSFVWQGRRYRWRATFDVTVESTAEE